MRPPFNFPEAPVDQFTIEYFVINEWGFGGNATVSHWKCVYHVNTLWRNLYPEAKISGADFVDEWQMFENGTCIGRREDWNWVRQRDWSDVYPSAVQAEKEIVETLKATLVRARARVVELESAIATREDRLEKIAQEVTAINREAPSK